MQQYDIIITGAGPAGLFAGIHCSMQGFRVLILEKNASAGKKLLLAGAGLCNFTHTGQIDEFLQHYGDNGRFIKKALYAFTNEDLIAYFKKKGVRATADENGKIFPDSHRAHDILDVLLADLKHNNAELRYNASVESIVKENALFRVIAGEQRYRGRAVLIATGGVSYPGTGSTGDGYMLAEKCGHRITEIAPALTPVVVKPYEFAELAGISFRNIPLYLYREGKKIRHTCGDVLFTHKNLSGPAILDFSRYIKKGDLLKICFVGMSTEECTDRLWHDLHNNSAKRIKNILVSLGLPERFVVTLCKNRGIATDIKAAQLTKNYRKTIIQQLTEYEFQVAELGDFRSAMATRGGIDIKDVHSATMESKLIEGLYFAGEVLDIDGDTGGYNLQAAFSTAYLVAQSINSLF